MILEIESIEKLEKLILLARKLQVKAIKLGDLTIEMSDLAFVADLQQNQPLTSEDQPFENLQHTLMTDNIQSPAQTILDKRSAQADFDELVGWSAP